MRAGRISILLVLAGCNSLLGIPGSGQIAGDGGNGDGPPVGVSCENTPDTCALHAVDRVIAQAGEKIILEGTFGNVVDVEFPDGLAANAQVLGPNRALVDVPGGATGGIIKVTTAGRTVGKVPFRGTTYQIGPTHFQVEYPQTSGGRSAPVLTVERAGASVITVRNKLFVLGGKTATPLRSIDVTTINADGTLSKPAISPASMTVSRAAHTTHLIGDFVHAIGGATDTMSSVATTETSLVNADGDLAPFSAGPSMTVPRTGHRSVVIGNQLYVIGGANGMNDSALDSVERATINPDGSLGAFSIVDGITLGTARTSHAAVVIRDHLYVLGGTTGTSVVALASIERAAINPDGTLQPFEPAGAMMIPRAGHGAFVFGDKLVLIGGLGPAPAIEATLEQAQIQASGDLGAFGGLPGRLEIARAGAAYAIAGNNLYVLGGLVTSGAAVVPVSSVEHTSLIQGGDLDTFALTGLSLSTRRTGFTTAALADRLYLFGGKSGGVTFNQIDRANISPGGDPAAFALEAQGMGGPRGQHASAVAGNTLHLIGGSTTGSNVVSTVDSARVNPDGTLAAFGNQGKFLSTAEQDATAVVVGNKLFVIGGAVAGGTSLDLIAAASLNSDGDLLTNFSGEQTMNTPRRSHCSAVIGPFIYQIAGDGGGVALATTERVRFTNGILSSPTNGPTLTNFRGTATCAVIGRFLYVVGDTQTSPAGRRVERAEIDPATFDLRPFEVVGDLLVQSRFESRAVELTNGVFILGGNDGSGNLLDSVERASLR
jgi:hypothetical protein